MRSETSARRVALAASLGPVLAGLVASAMLAVDYLRPAPVFCREGSGCEALKHTALAMPLGVPMPVVGLAGFLAIGVASLLAGRRARAVEFALSACAALAGVVLLIAQGVLGHRCVYCCVADASGIASGVVAGWRFASGAGAGAHGPLAKLLGALALAGAVATPIAVGVLRPSAPAALPEVIRAQIARAPRGKVPVVDFVDFECPFCRMTHAELEPMLEAHAARVHVVRRQVPLRSHPHALDAARAACCGAELGRGDEMANALFAAPVEELTREGCEKIASGLGLALDPFRACVESPKTDEAIEADRAEFNAAGGYALPTIWIGDVQLVGAQPREVLAKTLHEALARAGG
jgi:predicted DsbA family dithiol-disulfide isomerase/uncharacterized membrane protein